MYMKFHPQENHETLSDHNTLYPYCMRFGLKRQDDMVCRGTAEGSAEARCSSYSSSSSSFSTSSSSLSSSDDSLS
ncbi:hypothetical protein Tco_0322951 [Tanacetum coccineum]